MMSLYTFISISGYVISTIAGTVAGWILFQIKLFKPKIVVKFENNIPCIREDTVTLVPTVRLAVMNKGRVEARNCIVKMKIFNENGKLLKDNLLLHWTRNRLTEGSGTNSYDPYRPITIASNDYEFVDWVVRTSKYFGEERWFIYSLPSVIYDNLSQHLMNATLLPLSQSGINEIFKVETICYCDGAKPSRFNFFYSIQNDNLMVGKDKNQLKKITSCL